MMPSRSTPNLQQPLREVGHTTSIYSYLSSQTGINFSTTSSTRDENESPPPAPPVRDSSSLKTIKYGPGHEKFPSWPVPAAAETPQALRAPPSGGSHRSKSWTDHTNYPKEKVVTYTRPYMKRQHSSHSQQKLKTVMERCEKITPETFESRYDKLSDRLYLPHVDHDGKSLGDHDYMVPSPPERDTTKPQLTQADLEEYARSYQEPTIDKFGEYDSNMKMGDFIEYARKYEDNLYPHIDQKREDIMLAHLHQKQLSYAQSEGYHSYVSSTDSTSTPFLDRLRRDSEAVVTSRSQNSWDDLSEQESNNGRREGRDSVVTTSSGSASSSETLKWHGSMSDVSVASSSCTHLANSSNSSVSRQLIAHSARVQTPQRHHSESVLYIGGESHEGWKDRETRNNNANKLKLFPVNTYTVQDTDQQQKQQHQPNNRLPPATLSVADRINELEKQQKYSYLDPNKKHKVPDPTLKAIQKKALLSFYERHHSNSSNKSTNWRSEPQLAQSPAALVSVPQPPPRIQQKPSRRASCASDYASSVSTKRSSLAASREVKSAEAKITPRHQHSNSCGSLSTDLLGPVIVGPSISLDDWIPDKPPERPPKNPNLRNAFPDLFQDQRVPSPDLPPPSPPMVNGDEYYDSDEPLPPPPPDLDADWQQEFNERLKETNHQTAGPQVESNNLNHNHKMVPRGTPDRKRDSLQFEPPTRQNVTLPDRGNARYSSVRVATSKSQENIVEKHKAKVPAQILDFPTQKAHAERSYTRYPTNLANHKVAHPNGSIAVSQKVANGLLDSYRAEPLRAQVIQVAKDDCKLVTSHASIDIKCNNQRSSISEFPRDVPPPLQPRQVRVNQSMRGRVSHNCNGRPNVPDGRNISVTDSRVSPPRDLKPNDNRCFNIMSHSKASNLQSRRERERIVPDSDTGSYKRTMSPNGHPPQPEVLHESPRIHSRDTIWPLNKSNKDNTLIKNNTNILRRASMNDKPSKTTNLLLHKDEKDDIRKAQLVLPDVLPKNAKILGPRSQYVGRPNQLSLAPMEDFNNSSVQNSPKNSPKTPPSSPPKSPSRNSPFAPLRTTALSNSPMRTPSINSPIRTSPQSPRNSIPGTPEGASTPVRHSCNLNNYPMTPESTPPRISPPSSVKRTSPPQIRPSLSPQATIKPVPTVPASPPVSVGTNTPLRGSPITGTPPRPPSPTTSPPRSPRSPKELEYPRVVEGLQLIQRTEVVLRVNPCTIDASSQTDKEELPPTPLPTRKKLQEEIECEKLSEDFVSQLPTSDRLKGLLVPGPDHKKPTDYVTGLFRVDVTSRPRPLNSPFRSRTNTPSCSPPPNASTTNGNNASNPEETLNKTSEKSSAVPITEPLSPLSATSPYFTTSESKAKFLTRYSQDMNHLNIVKDTKDLSQKKEELVSRLGQKLEVLKGEQLVVIEECRLNDELGENVQTHVNRLARPHEAAKYRLHVEEIGKITSLLLGLSGRLARAENALRDLPEDHPERRVLESKRDKLLEQLDEAKKLKESIDRRSISVSTILNQYLNSEEYADYDHFINMKAKLIMDSKEIAEKIKLGEEQLLALTNTLIVTD